MSIDCSRQPAGKKGLPIAVELSLNHMSCDFLKMWQTLKFPEYDFKVFLHLSLVVLVLLNCNFKLKDFACHAFCLVLSLREVLTLFHSMHNRKAIGQIFLYSYDK